MAVRKILGNRNKPLSPRIINDNPVPELPARSYDVKKVYGNKTMLRHLDFSKATGKNQRKKYCNIDHTFHFNTEKNKVQNIILNRF